jgi:hypothetical protein
MKDLNMIQRILAACLSVALIFLASQARAQHPIEHVFRYDMQNIGDVWAQQYASGRPWHGNYYYQGTGQPTALVVPPNSVMHQTYSWGVSRNYSLPIYHQFGYQGMPSAGGAFFATPIWPSNTQQFGVYPVRAPW